MKDKMSKIYLVVLFAGMGLYLLITGIIDLTGKSNYVEAEIDMAGGSLTVEHSINGLIPTGNEYYYLGVNSEAGRVYIIRGTKKWLDENFDADGTAKNGSYLVKAKERKLDYKVKREFSNTFADIDLTNIELVTGTSGCLDINYKAFAVKKLICVVAFALTILSFWAVTREEDEKRKALLVKARAGLFLISAVLMIHVLSYL